jgi:hypothetical protein
MLLLFRHMCPECVWVSGWNTSTHDGTRSTTGLVQQRDSFNNGTRSTRLGVLWTWPGAAGQRGTCCAQVLRLLLPVGLLLLSLVLAAAG